MYKVHIQSLLGNRIINKLLVLFTTGVPGIQKILILIIVGLFYDVDVLGQVVNDIFIIYILLFFSGLNWSNILLVDVLKYPSKVQYFFFLKILYYSFVYSVLLLPLLFFLFRIDLIADLYGSFIYLSLFSVYQVWRHYYIAHKRYLEISVLDTLIIVFSYFLCFFFNGIYLTPLFLLSLPFLLPLVYVLYGAKFSFIVKNKFFNNSFNKELQKRAFLNSVSNFATGSLPLFIAPMAYRFLSAEYTVIIGFCGNLATSLSLIPRALSLSKIPILSKISRDFNKLKIEFGIYEKFLNRVLLIELTITCLLYILLFLLKQSFSSLNMPYLLTICALMLTTSIISQFVLPISNLIMILRKEGVIFKVNLLSFFLISLSFTIMKSFLSNQFFIIIGFQMLLIISHFLRLFFLKKLLDT